MKHTLSVCLAAFLLLPMCYAQDGSDLDKLKAKLAEQQAQIDSLRQTLDEQKKLIESLAKPAVPAPATGSADASASAPAPASVPAAAAPAYPRLGGDVASMSPVLGPPLPRAPRPAFSPQADSTSPLQIRIGNTTITPIGFMDLTADWKDKNAGGSLGSSFGSIPYNNASTAKLSEFRFSPQNSRIGFRVDGDWKDVHFIGYNEVDFLGTSGGNNLSVTNGAFVPRIRLYWLDLRKGAWEFLAGQSWSLLTPGRKGISPLPGDIFYSQVMDVNYIAGLTWTRQPGLRVVYHPNKQVAWGFSAENPDAYIGGSSGGSTAVLPSALTGLAGTQLDNQTNVQTTPNLVPDFISKLAFDPNSRVHFEVAGILRTFKVWNTTTGTPTSGDYFTKEGAGGSVNANLEVTKGFHLISNNYWSDGGGRYIFGQAPDLIIRSDGSISPIHSGGFNEGFEATAGKFLLFGYYGGIYIGRNVAIDANGTSLVGYGYRGSANSQNRAIQEVTFGFNETVWKDAKYGAINLIGQYEYLTRDPWYVALNAPKATHDNTIYFDVRYTLPGSAPAMTVK
jgi:hypothetical protein